MMSLSDLDLEFLPMETDPFAEDPFPYFAAARQRHPWLAKCTFGYVVHEHAAIKDLLWMDDRMRPSFDDVVELLGAKGTPWGRFQHNQLLNLSGDAHKRIRDVVAPMFTPAAANRNRGLMQQMIAQVLDEWAPKGAFDFEDFVSYYPISVMCTMIGASTADIPRLRTSLEALGLAFGMDLGFMPRVQEGMLVMDEFVQQLVAERRAAPPRQGQPDLLDELLGAVSAGKLTDREMYDLLVFLFVGGYDTSKNVLTLIMYEMLDRPEIYARCAEDLAYCRKVVEETLRFHSPAMITRLVGQDIEYRDVLLPAGSLLYFPVSVSGRDPRAFEHADEFLPERTDKDRHTAFGRGVHICLGQFIGRAQIEEGLHMIAQRLKNPRLAGPVGRRPFFGVWGLRGLPIAFEDARATGQRA